jgi:hypothetical protein
MRSYYFLICCWYLPWLPFAFPFYVPIPHSPCLCGRRSFQPLHSSNNDDFTEAMDSLQDFHVGQWQGSGAVSFTISNDVAAGILDRVVSPPYTCNVNVISTKNSGPSADVLISESYTLQQDITADERNSLGLSESVERNIILSSSNFDIDSVDGSYSLDGPSLPLQSILGLTTASSITDSPFFGIEHCISVNDDARARCFLIYNTENEQLCRVVVCHETRTRAENGEVSNISELSQYNISLLELCSGIWLGDAVIRDLPVVKMSPISDASNNKGFGRVANVAKGMNSNGKASLCSWTLGVQKFSWRLVWNFDEEIRQVVELGRGMGAPLENALAYSNLVGSVCPTPGVSRRTPKSDRIVYMDWKDAVGFVCGCVAIYAPRYRKFDFTRRIRPFYTQFAVFQTNVTNAANDSFPEQNFEELVCSKISRLYNYEGTLKQGVTSYSTLHRFDSDEV